MNLQQRVSAISPLDGRYAAKLNSLEPLVSEMALNRYRTQVECEWFLALSASAEIPELPSIDEPLQQAVRSIYQEFGSSEAMQIVQTEMHTNHDVKAVEYFVKERLSQHAALAAHTEFVHFACTSEDINNLSYALMLRDSRAVVLAQMDQLIDAITLLAKRHALLGMLSRTHGQPASPTTLGKEMGNFAARLQRQREGLAAVPLLGKMNGAVGNFNAHLAAYPEVDWRSFSEQFVTSLGLEINHYTTQIEPHDYMAEVFHAVQRFNQILLDFDRDIWSYISIEYFKQRKVEGETGSSTMPHKVNPIDFENSEGNLGLANALLDHMAGKLQVSRWQRDLSDSTVLRNIGSALGYCMLAYQATLKGLSRLEVNEPAISADLDQAWEVLAEAVQTVMRKHGLPEPYERLKAATRGAKIDAATYADILARLQLPDAAQQELAGLTPGRYLGVAAELAQG